MPFHSLQCHLWLGFLVSTFWPSNSLVDHFMRQGTRLETLDPFSFLGRRDMCFCYKISQAVVWKARWEDLHLHLCQMLQPFVASCHLAPLGQKNPKPLIPQRGTRADQRIGSVWLSHLRSYLPPWTRGSKGYFLSCYHFQYSLKPLFVICMKIFSLYSMNIS